VVSRTRGMKKQAISFGNGKIKVAAEAAPGDTKMGSRNRRTRVSEHELYEWIVKQKKAYREGRLERWQIEKLEELPDWSWD